MPVAAERRRVLAGHVPRILLRDGVRADAKAERRVLSHLAKRNLLAHFAHFAKFNTLCNIYRSLVCEGDFFQIFILI